ncbi:hypothetical protein TTHERM_01015950 (macronuclear) [Tetrahymena thermophila SB210]|uniref:Uncharacterized protein n=1 Tax=Tetrahymena thermophila (strain SB210) TaxID=312017 RepID=Q22CU6_TETTS|nr:hypothetical protein TTHERM_01015950 [Tetrahymena thermophila SB210]EAR83092.2 hypothetical protein TTHERM_01015950 [Tetrahymena thermophila SB210]|eukprot:XP_001030755.2 hypothetical protein TTHERM_01015950 [Tetrahymena thermophila SB210]
MDKFGLRPVSRQKGFSQSIGNNQSQVISPASSNIFRIKNVTTPYDSTLQVSGQQIKSDSTIFDHHNNQNLNYMLHMIDICSPEQQITTFIKGEISMIQQEINEYDKDAKIRNNSQKQEFNKGHVNIFKRWLLQNSRPILKYQDVMSQEFLKFINPDILTEQMKVESKEQCIQKLYRIVQGLDLFLLKLTEYLTITFIKYEDFISKNLPLESQLQNRVNNLIKGTQIFPSSISFIHQDRFNQLQKHCQSKMQEQLQNKIQHNKNSGIPFNINNDCPKSEIKTTADLVKYLESLKPNTLLNSDYMKQIKNILGHIEQISQQIQEEKTQKYQASHQQFKVQIDQLEKQVTFLQNDNEKIKLNNQKQLEDQEAKHIKEVEIMQNDIQQQIQLQIQEKVNSLNQKIKDQETQMNKLQAQYYDMLHKKQDKSIQNQNNLKEIKEVNKENQQNQQNHHEHHEDQQKAINLIDELKLEYTKLIENLRKESADFKQKYTDMKINCETTYQELLNVKQLLMQAQKEKEEIQFKFSQKFMSKQEFTDTFEQALKEEFKRMKKSFEDRIERLNQDIITLKRDKHKSINDMKQQLDREIETKNLLMKKLSIYLKF